MPLIGIPASVGGLVFNQNAGANSGKETKQILKQVHSIDFQFQCSKNTKRTCEVE